MATKRAAKKTARKGSATARKSTGKVASANKSTGKKSVAKKSVAKKSVAKKSAAKTSVTKKSDKTFKPGDKVAWDTSQGTTYGKVVKKQTTPTQIKTHKVAASTGNPEYIVQSEKSGKRAAHKPSELRKRG